MTISHFYFGKLQIEEKVKDLENKEIGKLELYENGFSLRYETEDEDISEKVPYTNITEIENVSGVAIPEQAMIKLSFIDTYGDKYKLTVHISQKALETLVKLKQETMGKMRRKDED
ncbi:hypothetical protein KO465_02495 [Candidatus Micrarchaeota archaeon]|nr:hypothetical protein [Candidatus Micrarchaeota archaeon]